MSEEPSFFSGLTPDILRIPIQYPSLTPYVAENSVRIQEEHVCLIKAWKNKTLKNNQAVVCKGHLWFSRGKKCVEVLTKSMGNFV